MLVAWGVTLGGRKVLLGLQLDSRESYESWLSFGRDLVARGLNRRRSWSPTAPPAPGKAAHELWPAADEQRCTVHNAQERHGEAARAPPPRGQGQVVAGIRRGRLAGQGAPRARGHRADYRQAYPSAMAVIERDSDALVAQQVEIISWPAGLEPDVRDERPSVSRMGSLVCKPCLS